MLDTSNPGERFSILTSISRKTWSWAIFVGVGVLLSWPMAMPAYAWWFTPTAPVTAVTPVHQQGLVVSPIARSLVPQFLLQPLSQTVVESPPSEEAGAGPSPTIIATPRPTLQLTSLAPTPTPATQSVAATTSYSARAQRILELVNQERANYGLHPLSLNAALTRSAQAYAEEMAGNGHFSHTGLNGSKFTQRNVAAGYTNWSWLEENIAYGQTSPEMVMSDWMESKDHRDNILNPHVYDLGVGIAGSAPIYWVQEFGAK